MMRPRGSGKNARNGGIVRRIVVGAPRVLEIRDPGRSVLQMVRRAARAGVGKKA